VSRASPSIRVRDETGLRLSDLLETPVADSSGRVFGHVQDVRLIQDGPEIGSFGSALAIEGFIVGRRRFGERLGFHRTNMHGPWLLKTLFERYHRASRFVPWERIVEIDGERISISGSASDLSAPQPLNE
jgi:sporulation protein YlmC with PRC-barrel domain